MTAELHESQPFKDVILLFIRGDFPTAEMQKEVVQQVLDRFFRKHVRLLHNGEGAPYLDEEPYFVSVSHCRKAVGVALSKIYPVGIDVEQPRKSLLKVAKRILKDWDDEFSSMPFLLSVWTYREATFKLLQGYDNPPSTIMGFNLFENRIKSSTTHYSDITVTVAVANW